MSYEGYENLLCEKGHSHIYDCYGYVDIYEWECPVCKKEKGIVSKCVWYTCVDQTNGEDEELGTFPGYVELEIDKPAKMEKCDKCGHEHLIEEETYKIPLNKGHRLKRYL